MTQTQLIMSQEEIDRIERLNSGTSMTGHQDFDRLGCLIIKNLYDVKELIQQTPPKERGQLLYGKTEFEFEHNPIEIQVNDSVSRYNYPKYKQVHSDIRVRIENIIERKLHNTYFYDRFYFVGQKLRNHVDRDSCEISVSLHVASSPKQTWPFYIKTAEGFVESAILEPGDALLYKGCERPHWRDPLPSGYTKKERMIRKLKMKEDDTWYHQIFFHYVLADGYRLHYSGDKGV